jgi:hypothetical protein
MQLTVYMQPEEAAKVWDSGCGAVRPSVRAPSLTKCLATLGPASPESGPVIQGVLACAMFHVACTESVSGHEMHMW